MNSKEAKQIDIVDFLALNGFKYTKQQRKDFWYISPIRDEKTASFKVNRNKNLWFDHGLGEGGTIIDLVLKIDRFQAYTVKEALAILDSKGANTSQNSKTKTNQKTLFDFNSSIKNQNREDKKNDEEIQKILKIGELKNYSLIDYVKSRKIDLGIAKKYLSEIYYSYNDKKYFALAFKNSSNGYETRSKYFKGTIGKKDITIIKGAENGNVAIFEGFFDFLSALIFFKTEKFKSDIIILNSVSLTNHIFKLLEGYKRVNLLLDNDKAGNEAKKLIEANFEGVLIDNSNIYQGYNDFNDFLQKIR